MNDLRIATRLGIATSVFIALMVVAGGFVGVAYAHLIHSEKRVTKTLFQAVQQSDGLATAYLDEETGVRGYALAGTTDYLQPYTDGTEQEAAANKALDADLVTEPAIRAKLVPLRAAARTWHSEFVVPTVEQIRAHGPGSVTPSQLAHGKRLFDTVRARQADYDVVVTAARHSAVADLRRARLTLGIVFGLVGLLLFIGLCLLFVALRHWILRPLTQLGNESLTVASGDIDHEVRIHGPPEFVAVANDVDVMRRRIRDQYVEAQDARASLEDQRRILAAQTSELSRSNAELEQFAYVASHDLQEPLRKVASFTQLLEQRYGDQLDERAHQYIEFAVDGSKRMQQLIQDLLTFSRVGRQTNDFVDVSLDLALDIALRGLAHRIDDAEAVVVREPLPVVHGDEGLLAQVFQNLVGNAVKFHRPGEPPHVRISSTEADDLVTVSVSDDGIGIPPEFEDKVFAIFQRLNRREEYEGTGIGLALCRKIVEYHGGDIRLEVPVPAAPLGEGPDASTASGEPGASTQRGTTFTFTLPRRAPQGDHP